MKLAIGSDHAGFDLKTLLIGELSEHQIIDCGCDNSTTSVDYPDFAKKVAKKILDKEADLGILICGSGIGVSIAANRFNKIRAALCHNLETAQLAKAHNNANILCLGSRIISTDLAKLITKTFLSTPFDGDRHLRRIEKLD